MSILVTDPGDLETWRHGNLGTWRSGDLETFVY